jgi:hypothetical protein
MPGFQVEVDTRELMAAIRYVFDNTHKTMPAIVNRAALVTIIGGKGVTGAMRRTMRASRQSILAVPEKLVAGHVMNRHKGEKLTRTQIKALVKKEYRRRVAAIGYTANVGWSKAARAFGGTGVGRRATGRGYATLGYGKPASSGDLAAEAVNTAPVAALIGAKPLQEALEDTARDMVEHAGGEADKIIGQAGLK